MKQAIIILAVLAAICTVGNGDETNPESSSASLSSEKFTFLKAGQDYVIVFPPSYELFTHQEAGISPTTLKGEDGSTTEGKPATWTVKMSVTTFHLVQFGGGSWVQVEYPANPSDAFKWNAQRRALATLRDPEKIPGDTEEDRAKQGEELQAAAAQKIETSKIWINLDHAVAISDVPTGEAKLKWSIKSVTTSKSLN